MDCEEATKNSLRMYSVGFQDLKVIFGMAMRRINKLHFNVKMKENFLFGHRRYRKLLSNGTSPMHAYANRSAK